MLASVAQRVIVIAFLGLLFFWSTTVSAGQFAPETKVVAQLYKNHGWMALTAQHALFGEGLRSESKLDLEKYFAPDLAGLFVADAACVVRERGICHLDFDPLFASQDPCVTDLEVRYLSSGKVSVQFKDPVTNETTQILFELGIIRGEWKITDILYRRPAPFFLKEMLSRPAPKG